MPYHHAPSSSGYTDIAMNGVFDLGNRLQSGENRLQSSGNRSRSSDQIDHARVKVFYSDLIQIHNSSATITLKGALKRAERNNNRSWDSQTDLYKKSEQDIIYLKGSLKKVRFHDIDQRLNSYSQILNAREMAKLIQEWGRFRRRIDPILNDALQLVKNVFRDVVKYFMQVWDGFCAAYNGLRELLRAIISGI